jgi:hypothetical protein
MEPLQTYDCLVRARQRVFDWVRPLGVAISDLDFNSMTYRRRPV